MATEELRIFDEDGKVLGIASREEVHQKGYWHETFHCWIVSRKEGKDFIHLQLRSSMKKDFPGLFDITAAGHILADETVEDGVREIEEELGLALEFNNLISLGTIKDQLHQKDFIDNERCHTFLYMMDINPDLVFELQKEEVAGIISAEFESFADLCFGNRERIDVDGFEIADDGSRSPLNKSIGIEELVPHSPSYLEQVTIRIKDELEKWSNGTR